MRPGLVFQEQGELHLTNNQWISAVVLDLSPTISALDQIIKNSKSVTTALAKYYPADKFSMEVQLQRLQQQVEAIRQISTTSTRSARAPLEFVGSLMNSLFGTATDSDVQALMDKMGQLDTKMDRLSHFNAEQLSILNITATHQQQQDQQIDTLTHAFKQLDSMFQKNYAHQRTDIEKSTVRLYQLQIISDCQQLSSQLVAFIEGFDYALSGHLSPIFLRPSEFRTLLNHIAVSLPINVQMQLPLKPGSELHWYKICKIHHVIAQNNKLTLFLTVPLTTSRSQYRLYKTFPITTPINDSYFRLSIPSYFAISVTDNKIFSEFNVFPFECFNFDETYYCPEHPFTIRHSSVPTCLYDTFMQSFQTPCPKITIINPETQISKITNNQYLVNAFQPTTIDWHCDVERHYPNFTSLHGIKLVTIPPTCHGLLSGKLISSDFSTMTTLNFNFSSNVLLQHLEMPAQQEKVSINIHKFIDPNQPKETLYHIHTLDALSKIDEAHEDNGHLIRITGLSISSALLIIVISTSISVIVSHCWLKNKLQALTPITRITVPTISQPIMPEPIYEMPMLRSPTRRHISRISLPAPPSPPPLLTGQLSTLNPQNRRRTQSLAELEIYE